MNEHRDDDSLDPDTRERIAAALAAGAAKSGIPLEPFTDAQQRENDALAHAMTTVAAIDICGVLDADGNYDTLSAYDSHDLVHPISGERVSQGDMILQMLAAERWRQYVDACQADNDRLVDPRQAPSYDEADPLTATRLYVLTKCSEYLTPLEIPHNWIAHVRATMFSSMKCQAHLLHRCYDHQATPAAKALVYKRGEVLYAFRVCSECLDALSWIGFGHPDYGGPMDKWVDKGERTQPREW